MPSRREAERTLTARANQAKAKWSRVRFRDNRLEETKGGVTGRGQVCWCEQPAGHDWPGKDEGEAHPR